MDVFRLSERLIRMDDAAWARHENPISVFSRFTVLPLLAVAVWSRVWLGPWALGPVAAVVLWAWINPRLFPPPARHGSWAVRAVRGERMFLDRAAVPVPAHHLWPVRLLALLSGLGIVILGWGLWRLDPGFTLAGLILSMGAKAWLVDRMAWLHDERGGLPGPGRRP